MLRPRARVARATLAVPRPALVCGLLLGLILAAGCGSSGGEKKADAPSKATVVCREKWKALEDKIGDRDSATQPSALAQRWNSIAATVGYYAISATKADCDEALANQDKAMVALTAFSARLKRYDMEARLERVKAAGQKYATSPRPSAPKPTPSKKGKKKKKAAPRAPKPTDIAAALKTCARKAPLATQQQDAGWQQARVIDLADKAAMAKTVKDLSFLSTQSPAYRACTAALNQVRTALRAAGS
jgi:hypothetical protein